MAVSDFCVVIPVYNHEGTVGEVARKALGLGAPVVVVDDGSTDGSRRRVESVAGIRVLRHGCNKGKGAALLTGFSEASKTCRWALTLDADGQHDPSDAPSLLNAVPEGVRPIVVGTRTGMTGEAVPWTSRFGREFSNFWVRLSGGPKISDSQSGFRLYPLPEVLHLGAGSKRFQFEVEILARAGWKGIPVVEAPVGVDYMPMGRRISHFRPFLDFFRNSNTFSWLILQRIVVPASIRRKW
jgi:glycosyltransferase involved in cell wall biosynthesis